MIGKTLGHYEILEPLGAGGMGEVYRARDTTLKREVAIKVLPEDLAADPDRLARLEHEAHLLASLNHPNIATIHSLERSGDTRFLVLELVKGESLDQRLAKGPLPTATALDVCKQIAQALEAAHGESIIHRDLKPANVLITLDGRAKVLDFGLAKAFEADAAKIDLTQSPTLTVAGTQTGVILGTAPYMSPEQVRGKPLDKRIDIWAFGCVLYEALTSSRAFARETVADTLAAILESDPNWGALPAATPHTVQTLIKRCLQKDPARRLHDIADARIEIEEALAEPAGAPHGSGAPVTAAIESPSWRRAIPWAAAPLVVGVALGAAGMGMWFSVAPAQLRVYDVQVKVKEGWRLSGGDPAENEPRRGIQRPSRTAMAISPDGRLVVYNATDGERSQLYLRSLDQDLATPIQGTEGAFGPFFSPDGQSVGFFTEEEDGAHLRSVDIDSQVVRIIATDVGSSVGASWGDNDIIVLARFGGGLRQASASGGSLEPLTTKESGEYGHWLPHVLPGSKAALFTVPKTEGKWDEAQIAVVSLETNVVKKLIMDGADARYVSSEHILFARRGTLMAVRFDPERLEISGPEVTVREDLMQAIGSRGGARVGSAQYAISDSGTLVYVTGGIYPEPERSLVLVGQDGMVARPFNVPRGGFLWPRLSPDGTRIAYVRGHGASGTIYAYDIANETTRQLTFGSAYDRSPVWSPDGKWIAFTSDRGGRQANKAWRIGADGGGEPELLTTPHWSQPASWSEATGLLYWTPRREIWTLPLQGDPPVPTGDPQRFESSERRLMWPAISPNGEGIAYVARLTDDQDAVWVRPYPGLGTPSYVTAGGNSLSSPTWSRDGSQIFYRAGDDNASRNKMMVVDVTPGEPFDVGVPRQLFDEPYINTAPIRSFDVDADGNFVMITYEQPVPQPVTEMHVIINWVERLKERLPTGR